MDLDPATEPAAVAETHSGVVFFLGDKAYKIKKPLDLGFVDFRSRESRLTACRKEVELNRRIAPDVYLGVADIVGVNGCVCDHLVVMRRMPTERRLSTLVASDPDVATELTRLARLLASFHRSCPSSPAIDAAATRDAQRTRWEANSRQMEKFAGDVLDAEALHSVMDLAHRYLSGRGPAFDRRIQQGCARDGHGDLLADDIFCLDDGPRVLDCLEFDEHLRYGDVLADVAFLAMDLERLGRPDLATAFLSDYRRAAQDSWPASLAHHYIAYRAQVRAKVTCLRWSQGDQRAGSVAGQLLDLCSSHLRRGRVHLVVVGGLPGTGKSTVAKGIAAATDGVVLRSDEIRKQLVGLDPLTPSPAVVGEGLYRPEQTAATYAEMLVRAEGLLGLGYTVVLDATWRDRAWRAKALAMAAAASADYAQFRCKAPLELSERRLAIRLNSGRDPSDANLEVLRAMAATDLPWNGGTVLDTSGDVDRTLQKALKSLDNDWQRSDDDDR